MLASLRLVVVLLVAFIGQVVVADTSTTSLNEYLAEFPTCALKCLLAAASNSTCATTDTACQCADTQFVSQAELCVTSTCTVVESLTAKNITQTMCGAPIRDKSNEYSVMTITLATISSLFVIVRLGYRKFFTGTDLGLDDWFVLITLLSCVPSAVINVTKLSANGLGRDIWTLTPDQITVFAKYFWVITLLYFWEVFVLKLSLLFFYQRIFPGRAVRGIIIGAVVVDVLFGIGFIITALLQCRPISYNWTNWRGEGGGQCIDISKVAWANAAISIALDLLMLIIPLSQLRELKLHWKKKIGVALMFCVGTFVTIVSIIRLASLVEFRQSSNLSWDYYGVSMWSTVELTIGIICACMPSMRLILVSVAPKVFDVTLKRTSRYYQNRKSRSFHRGSTMIKSKSSQPTDTDISTDPTKSAASRRSWMPAPASAHARNSWRNSRVLAEGVLFSKVAPPGLDEAIEVDEEDDRGRLMQLSAMVPSKYHSEVTISSAGMNSRVSTPDPHHTPPEKKM